MTTQAERALSQDEPACRFILAIPPSVNNLFRDKSNAPGRARSMEYKKWIATAGWEIKCAVGRGSQQQYPLAAPYRILIEAPLSRRRDLDNAQKPVLDILVSMGVIKGDNWIDDLRIVRPDGATVGDDVTVSNLGNGVNPEIVRYVFDRIPALGELRGVARLNAEEVIENAIADAIDEYLMDCEMVAMTGGAP